FVEDVRRENRQTGIDGKDGKEKRQLQSTKRQRRQAPVVGIIGSVIPNRGSRLPAAAAEKKCRQYSPDDRQNCRPRKIAPVVPQSGVRENGENHAGAMLLQREIREKGNGVLLANEQNDTDDKEIAHGPETGGTLGAGEAGDGQADAHGATHRHEKDEPEE